MPLDLGNTSMVSIALLVSHDAVGSTMIQALAPTPKYRVMDFYYLSYLDLRYKTLLLMSHDVDAGTATLALAQNNSCETLNDKLDLLNIR